MKKASRGCRTRAQPMQSTLEFCSFCRRPLFAECSYSKIAEFGRSKKELLRLFLRLEHRMPMHDAFQPGVPSARTILPTVCGGFAKANGLKLSGVATVDGRALRAAYERRAKRTPLHLVNALPWTREGLWRSTSRLRARGRRVPSRCWSVCAWKAASSRPMRWIATAALLKRCLSAAAMMLWSSRPIAEPCWRRLRSSLRD